MNRSWGYVRAKRPVPAWRPLVGLIRSLSALCGRDPSQSCRQRSSDVLPAGVVRLGRDVLVIFPGLLDLVGRLVAEPRVRPVVVAVDIAADAASRVVESFVFVQPHLPFLCFPNQLS